MERINLVELLKDCIGMELDCAVFNDARLEKINSEEDREYPIQVNTLGGCTISLTKYGTYMDVPEARCIIFPKGKTTWEGFYRPNINYINGDVIVDKYGAIAIYKQVYDPHEEPLVDFHCGLTSKNKHFFIKDRDSLQHCGEISSVRLATEKEREELFQAIKDNGYKWNPETKTLEKLIEPEFKIGDRIKNKTDKWSAKRTIKSYDKNIGYFTTINDWVLIEDQDNWELVPDKFDINTLVSFESRVLVRHEKDQRWIPAFWGGKCIDGYTTTFGWSKYCIPFDGNEHLLNSSRDCDEYFKTWEKTGD